MLIDDDDRLRIAKSLDETLFVEAGAGSGKTSALIDRVIALIESGIALRAIAAITFTEKAGAELRDRLRAVLQERAASGPVWRDALDQLDGAAIGTLHSFARSILSEHPVEAGLPPAIEVLDDLSSRVALDQEWRVFQDALFADPAYRHALLIADACGIRPDALKQIAVAFADNWDLVEERVAPEYPEPGSVRDLALPLLDAIVDIGRRRVECATPDALCTVIDELLEYGRDVANLEDDLDIIEALRLEKPSFRVGNSGNQRNWDDIVAVRADIRAAGELRTSIVDEVATAAAGRLIGPIRTFTLACAARRRAEGALAFHDLLVLCRAVLRQPDVQRHAHRRYERILLDEFQDTDPIQIELATTIAAEAPPEGGDWATVDVSRGHLFFVGDRKQSIYRFRRADIETFEAASARFGPPVELTSNFRTVAPILGWINATFSQLIDGYGALAPVRHATGAGPAVSVLGRTPHPDASASELRAAEAHEVARTVARAVTEPWQVDEGGWRDARLGDVCVLVPARTSLPFLEEALDAYDIPFRAESSSLVYASRAVRDLLVTARAATDPTDALLITAALRTPLFGCGDDELYVHRRDGHSWNYLADQPDTAVGDALRSLRDAHERSRWATPSELLAALTIDRRAFELGFTEGRPRDVWRRLRFVVDQARAWSEAAGGSVREYLAWVDQQTAEGARVMEAILPETDDDAVRIMTIHAAKGLEFPITILSGMSTVANARHVSVNVTFPHGSFGYKVGSNARSRVYQEWQPIDEQLDREERIRLLYVACTRARDHLVVSLHRKQTARGTDNKTNAELLAIDALVAELPDTVQPTDEQHPHVPDTERPPPPPDVARWRAERAAALAREPTTVAATALGAEGEPDAGFDKHPRDLDLPPWLKGRYGNEVGRAVHGVLQTIDLATGARIDALVAAQCEAEAIPGSVDDVTHLVRYALAAPSVQEAARSPHWREVFACVPLDDGRMLEGYIDLLYRSPAGLVIADYKTASTSDLARLAERRDGYRTQGASYALAIAATTGEPVARVVFVFLTPSGSVELELDDVEAAVGEVRAQVARGAT